MPDEVSLPFSYIHRAVCRKVKFKSEDFLLRRVLRGQLPLKRKRKNLAVMEQKTGLPF